MWFEPTRAVCGRDPGIICNLVNACPISPHPRNGEVLIETQQIHMCSHGVNLSGLGKEWGPFAPRLGREKVKTAMQEASQL